jgi:hypothetical protein
MGVSGVASVVDAEAGMGTMSSGASPDTRDGIDVCVPVNEESSVGPAGVVAGAAIVAGSKSDGSAMPE